MNVKLRKWGNSIGIRIPAEVLSATHLDVGAELLIQISKQKNSIILKPAQSLYDTWKTAFNASADAQEDELLIDDSLANAFDKDEWQW